MKNILKSHILGSVFLKLHKFWSDFDLKMKERKFRAVIYLFLFAVSISIVVARRTDSVFNPQFYAEDGVFWYSEAYESENLWAPFLTPKQSYFQTFSRLGAFFAIFFDLNHGPMVLNFIAIIMQISPALFFMSSRFDRLMPKRKYRILLGILYLLLPASFETHANITNSQWRLSIMLFLVMIATPSKIIGWKIFDYAVLAIGGLSGPFVFFALPIYLLYAWKTSLREKIINISILASTFLIQAYSFLFINVPGAPRSDAPLGAGFLEFFKLVTGKVFISGIFGIAGYADIKGLFLWKSGTLPIVIGLISIAMLLYVFRKSIVEMKMFIIYSTLIFFAALASPQVSLNKNQWEAMLSPTSGNRYFLLPIMAWLVSICWLYFNGKRKLIRFFAGFLLVGAIFVGIPRDFFFKHYKDYGFSDQVENFKNISPGENFVFKIPPGWSMELKKNN